MRVEDAGWGKHGFDDDELVEVVVSQSISVSLDCTADDQTWASSGRRRRPRRRTARTSARRRAARSTVRPRRRCRAGRGRAERRGGGAGAQGDGLEHSLVTVHSTDTGRSRRGRLREASADSAIWMGRVPAPRVAMTASLAGSMTLMAPDCPDPRSARSPHRRRRPPDRGSAHRWRWSCGWRWSRCRRPRRGCASGC